jgi:hypothetical protein
MGSTGSLEDPVVGPCEHSNKTLVSVKVKEISYQMCDYKPLLYNGTP